MISNIFLLLFVYSLLCSDILVSVRMAFSHRVISKRPVFMVGFKHSWSVFVATCKFYLFPSSFGRRLWRLHMAHKLSRLELKAAFLSAVGSLTFRHCWASFRDSNTEYNVSLNVKLFTSNCTVRFMNSYTCLACWLLLRWHLHSPTACWKASCIKYESEYEERRKFIVAIILVST